MSEELQAIAEKRKRLREFCFNQLSHVIIEDTRPRYLQKREIFVPGAIKIHTEEGNISEGLFNLLQESWGIGVRKVQKYYSEGDKKLNNPFVAAYCAALNQAILTFYNTSLDGTSVNVNDIIEAEQLIRSFQMFGAVSLGEFDALEMDATIENLQKERDQYKKELEKLQKQLDNIPPEYTDSEE